MGKSEDSEFWTKFARKAQIKKQGDDLMREAGPALESLAGLFFHTRPDKDLQLTFGHIAFDFKNGSYLIRYMIGRDIFCPPLLIFNFAEMADWTFYKDPNDLLNMYDSFLHYWETQHGCHTGVLGDRKDMLVSPRSPEF